MMRRISNNAEQLLFVYDCETTGLNVYDDHITDVAAMVVASPMSLSAPTFSSLVKTSTTAGMYDP